LLVAFLFALLSSSAALADAPSADLAARRAQLEAVASGGDDRAAAEALFRLGEMDDVSLDFPRALSHYEAVGARLPSSPYTPRANRRALDLKTHQEGAFAPLVRLETVRRSPTLADDPAAIDALVRDAAAFPPGKVRVDARMLAAEAYAGRLHRKDDALPLLRLVAEDRDADVLTARAAATELLAAYTDARDYRRALGVIDDFPKLLPARSRQTIERLARRGPIRVVAWSDLAILATFALLSAIRHRRVLTAVRRLAPMAVAFAVVATGVSGFLASQYEQSNPYPFAALAPAMFVVFLLSRAWSAGGSSSRLARALRASVSFAGVFGAAFLLLDRMDPTYLSGFGL
jgi:tetratricopeptide (TPR) repeat protein